MCCEIWMDSLKGINNILCELGYVLGFSIKCPILVLKLLLHYLNKINSGAVSLFVCTLDCLYLPVRCFWEGFPGSPGR